MTDKEKFLTLLEQVFDLLYNKAEQIINEEKPCEHEVTKFEHSCVGKTSESGGANRPQCCCSGCRHFNNGCKANKPLTCKCWLCPIARLKHPTTSTKLWKLDNLVVAFHFWIGRGTKEKSIQQSENGFCYDYDCDLENHLDYKQGLNKLIILIKKHNIEIDVEKFS